MLYVCAVDAPDAAKACPNDELKMLYLHLSSMRNPNDVKDRFIGMLADQAKADETDTEAAVTPVNGTASSRIQKPVVPDCRQLIDHPQHVPTRNKQSRLAAS